MKKHYVKQLLFFTLLKASLLSANEYSPSLYGDWIDADKDCQDTRQEVLIEESLKPVELDDKGCKVLSGLWLCPYTNRYFTDPSLLDIDHLVPLAEAHRSGADTWDREKRKAYANDLELKNALIAVYRGANRSKKSRTPVDWMPENKGYWCEYLKGWVRVKTKWNLSYSTEEQAKIKEMNFGLSNLLSLTCL